MSATSGEALLGVRRWETRGEVARHGTWRALLWSVFIAVVFFELTHPRRLIPDFPVANLVLAGLTAGMLLLDHRNVRLPRIPWTIVAYLALCAASVLWSIGRPDTVRMTLLYAWIALLACICVTQTDTQTLLRGISWGGVLVVAVTLISVLVDPEKYGGGLLFPGAGPGVHGTRGVLGYSLALAMAAACARRSPALRARMEIGATVAIILVGAAIAPAVTGRLGTAAVLVGWLGLKLLRRLNGAALRRAWVVIVGLIVLTVVVGFLNLSTIATAFGRSPDLSGRFKVWGAIIPVWLEAPVGGYGFGAVWYYAWWRLGGSELLTQMNTEAGTFFYHGHNVFIDVLPQLGALGLIAVILILALLAQRGVAGLTSDSEAPFWALLVLIALLVMGIAEPMLAVPVGWFSAVAATAAARPGSPRPERHPPSSRS